MIPEAELARQRGLIADAEREVQHAVSELIASRNALGEGPAPPGSGMHASREAAAKRVTLVLEAHDLLKRAGLVRP